MITHCLPANLPILFTLYSVLQQIYLNLNLTMIQRLLEIQQQNVNKAEGQAQQVRPSFLKTKQALLNIDHKLLASIPEAKAIKEHPEAEYEIKMKSTPRNNRAALNRKMIFIKTRNRSSFHCCNFKTHTAQFTDHRYAHRPDSQAPLSRIHCFAVPPTKQTIIHKKNRSLETTCLDDCLPICSKIRKIGIQLEDGCSLGADSKKARSLTTRSMSKKRTIEFRSCSKIRIVTEVRKHPSRCPLSDSIEISPWKYTH